MYRIKIFILICIVMWPGFSPAAGFPRLALVIGNAAYDHAIFPPLSNPVYDARDVARVLESFCFEVILKENADRKSMLAAIEEFGRRLSENGGLGLFYYSGHGLQHQQQHYLIPLRSGLHEEEELAIKAIDADTIAQQMELAGNAPNILIFDTCREQLVQKNFGLAGKDFIAMKGPADSVIVFSTSLGQSAFGESVARNSLYTRHLVQALHESADRDLLELLRTVTRQVTDEATYYRINAQSWQFLHKKGVPEGVLHALQQPQLYQVDFTQQQFKRALQELLSPEQYAHYSPLIQSSAEQSQAPWLYTNITEEIILSESCPSAPGNRPPLNVDIVSHPDTDELFVSPESPPMELTALPDTGAGDVRYVWTLNSGLGHLEGDITSSHVRYVPPERLETGMTSVSITLTVQRADEESQQEKVLTLLAGQSPKLPSLPEEKTTSALSSNTWKWIAGVGTIGGAAATLLLTGNSDDTDTDTAANKTPFTGDFSSGPVSSLSPEAGTLVSNTGEAVLSGVTFWTDLEIAQQDDQIYGLRSKQIYIEGCPYIEGTESLIQGSVTEPGVIRLGWTPLSLTFSCGSDTYIFQESPLTGHSAYRLLDDGNTLLGFDMGADLGVEFRRIQ